MSTGQRPNGRVRSRCGTRPQVEEQTNRDNEYDNLSVDAAVARLGYTPHIRRTAQERRMKPAKTGTEPRCWGGICRK
jgi:hypothetical protein